MMPSETPQPPAVMQRLTAFVAPRPSFEDTCERIAREFRTLAHAAYAAGDQRRGDRCTAKSLYWEMCAGEGRLLDE